MRSGFHHVLWRGMRGVGYCHIKKTEWGDYESWVILYQNEYGEPAHTRVVPKNLADSGHFRAGSPIEPDVDQPAPAPAVTPQETALRVAKIGLELVVDSSEPVQTARKVLRSVNSVLGVAPREKELV